MEIYLPLVHIKLFINLYEIASFSAHLRLMPQCPASSLIFLQFSAVFQLSSLGSFEGFSWSSSGHVAPSLCSISGNKFPTSDIEIEP